MNPQHRAAPPIPFSFAKRHGVVAIQQNDVTTLFFREPPSLTLLNEVERLLGFAPVYQQVEEDVFTQHLTACYQESHANSLQNAADIEDHFDLTSLADAVPNAEDLMESSDDAPVIRLINALLTEAIRDGASDVHIETFEHALVVRIRIDGLLKEILTLPRTIAALLISRIKVMAKLDIAEKRLPQDGRIALRVAGKEVDVRVSTLPSSNGERVVLRLLDKSAGQLDLDHLGMSDDDRALLENLLIKPHGILLVTGPTGSGKTTSLYASLSALNDTSRNILTVEDPIEYNLDGIGQTQVNSKVEMTFARGLRAILRQDPDVVMIGEIRDAETAEIAVQASLTGHLVLSTLHTNSATGALTRLQDMGVEPFLMASSLLGVIAQRLVRVLCTECKTPYHPDSAQLAMLHLPQDEYCTLYQANGCSHCNHTGFRGRTGIYEVIAIDEQVRRLIHAHQSEQAIDEYVHQHRATIQQDGIRKVLAGITTLEEVMRVTRIE